MIITEQEIHKCFDFLRDSAPAIANARHAKVKTEEMRKVIWSQLRRESDAKTEAQKDAYAYAHDLYIMHIDEMAEAAKQFQLLHAQREAAISKIDAWRTSSANERGAHRVAS